MIGLAQAYIVHCKKHGASLMVVPGYVYEIHQGHATLLTPEEASEKGYKEEAMLATRLRDDNEITQGN